MAYVDITQLFDEDFVHDAGTPGAQILGDVIDLGPAAGRTPSLQNLHLVIECTEACADGVADVSTIELALESDIVETLDSAPVIHWSSGRIACGLIQPGNFASLHVPVRANFKRWLGVRMTVLDDQGDPGTITAGKFTAYLTPNPSLRTHYPNAI